MINKEQIEKAFKEFWSTVTDVFSFYKNSFCKRTGGKMKLYKLTKKHKAQLKPWAEKWISNAMSTKEMDEEDKQKMREAIVGLYKSANLEPPPLHRIVFVKSPFIARFAAGFAAAIWYLRKNKTTRAATYAATNSATDDATRDATVAATVDATYDATYDATVAATDDATVAATYAATDAAIYAATRAATYAATNSATDSATRAATRAATVAATDDATRDATDDATVAATDAATDDATRAATVAATYAATRDATYAATNSATDSATRAATRDATYAATRAATVAATDDATRDATYAATYAATDAATRDATDDATRAATDKNKWYNFDVKSIQKLSITLKLGAFGLSCANLAHRFYQGGNMWSGWTSFLSFFRHVVKLKIDYSKWQHYEAANIHGGFRFMHEKFCIISDRPKTLMVNNRNQPHCEYGPFCEWRDGSALFALNGVRVPAWICLTPKDKFTKEMILREKNADVRREIIRKIGIEKTIEILGAKTIDKMGDYELITIDIGDNRVRPWLKMLNPSIKQHHIEGVAPHIKTVKDAIKWRNGLDEYVEPIQLT